MAKWFYGSRFISAVAQGVTRFFTLAGEQSPATLATGTEVNQQTLCRSSYTASNLWCNVTAITGTLTITDRKNGGAGGQSISVTTTGTKEDTTHTTSLADGDLYCIQGVMSNSHGDACTLQTMSVILDDGGTIAPMIIAGGLGTGSISANNFAFVAGTPSGATTETDTRVTIRFNATFSRMRAFITGTASGEFDYYFNGVAGTQALSFTAESGAKEDTTATDIVASGETWNVKWISASGANSLSTFQTKSNATANLLVASRTGIAGIGASTTNYYPIGSTLTSPATTEANAQIKARVADTWKNFQANIIANSRSDSTTIDFRAGAASPSGGPALSVSGGTTGIIEDLTGSYTSTTTDLINFRLVVGGGTGTISITAIGVQQGDVAGGLTQSASDSINNLADARALGYGNLHADSFTLSDTAQVVLGYALNASDNANNLADGAVKVVGTITTLADTLATLADANAQLLGYLLALSDSEAANWADAHQLLLAQQLALADNSFNAADAATLNLAQLEPLTDSLPDLADDLAYTLGIQNSFSDSFSLSDSLPITALGFNFRELADWVVDGPNQTYVILDEDYPVTRAGITFGYNDIGPDDAHHYESVDVRLSGSHQILHAISRRVNFRVFLDPGDYFITLAIGDKNSTVVNGYAEVQDNTTSRFVLSSLTAATGDFVDAAGNVWSEADWPANNVAVRVTIASGILNLKLGVPEDSGRTTISHLAFALADASAQPAPFAIGYGLVIPESITFSDSSTLGYGLLVDDSLTLTDACVIQLGQQLALSDSIDNLDDSSTQQLHEVTAEFQLELDDQISLSDSASVQLDHLELFSDALSLADNETHTLGYPLALADDTNSLADSVELRLAQFIVISDSLVLTDSLSLILSYELSTTDAFSLTDSHTSELGQLAQFADTVILTDAFTLRMAHLAQFSDAFSLSDDELTVLGYEQNATDNFSLNDAARSELTHLLSFAETVSLSDALSLGIGLALADSAAVFDDSISVQFHHLLDFSESLTFTDNAVIVLGYEERAADAVSFSDSAGEELSQLLSLADVLTLIDAASFGLGLTLSDSAANLSDSVSLQFEQLLEFDDALNLADTQSSLLGHDAQFTDSLSLSDAETHQLDQQLTFSDFLDVLDDALAATVGETFNFSDTLALADSTQLGYGLVLTDDSNLYMDDILTSAPQGPLREVGMTDALQALADEVQLRLDYLLAVADDAATLDDSISLQEEFRASLSASFSLTDSLAATLDHLQLLSDSFTLSDAVQLRLGYEIPTTDTLVLTDSSVLRLGYELPLDDSLTLTDSISLAAQLQLALNDAISLTDAQDATLGYRSSLSDSFTLSDSIQLRLGHELAVVDTISLSDAANIILTYLLTLTDNAALLADSAAQTLGLALIISDNGPVLTDAISLFSAGQLQLTDALSLTDSLAKFSAGFIEFEDTFVISDSVSFDLRGPDLDEALSDALQLADVIALSLNDELRLELQLTDLITLTDHYFDLRFPYTPSAKRHIVVPSRARVTKVVKRAGIIVPPSPRTTRIE